MEVDFHKGFIVYRKGPGPVFIAPHSGPALEVPTSRDENADTVASLCWLRMGGSLVVSTVPRKVMLGIDFNREAPSEGKALSFWEKFEEEKELEELKKYRMQYAWVAPSKKDHRNRLRIHKDFWKSIKGLGNTIVFLHRKFTRMKNFPSIMDIVTYKSYGVNRDIMNSIISSINRRYGDFFKRISENYKNAILLEEKRTVDRIMKIFSKFDLNDIKIEYKENINSDLEVIRRFADAKALRRLTGNFSERNFLSAVRSALKKDELPRVTLEEKFRGEPAWSRKRGLFRSKNMMEVEMNAFLNYWYPNEAAEIIMMIIDNIRTIRKLPLYTKMEW